MSSAATQTPPTRWSTDAAWFEWTVTAFVAVLMAAGAAADWRDPWLVLPAAVVAVASTVVARRRGAAGIASLAVGIVAVAVVCLPSPGNPGWFATCVLLGWGAVDDGLRASVVLAGTALAASAVADLRLAEEGWGPWYAGIVFTALLTPMVHRQRRLYDDLQAAQADLADAAATRERVRIARELHDVIGHALTVSLLHVTSARLALAEDPAEAEAALAEAERLGRQSLEEVRHAVGVVRDGSSPRRPLPGAADLAGLVDQYRRTGATLTWDVDGDPADLSGSAGLVVFRVLQEALTNVGRHAAGAPTAARLAVHDSGVELVVASDAPPAGGPPGAGLLGMRERVESLGGTLEAGPAGTGWRVRARWPTGSRQGAGR